MRARLSKLAGMTALLALLISPIATASAAPAKPGMQITKSAPASVSQPLRSITPLKVDPHAPSAARSMQDRRLVIPKTLKAAERRLQRCRQHESCGRRLQRCLYRAVQPGGHVHAGYERQF